MIKVNVEINNKSWHSKIKNPKKYFQKRLNKIFKIISFFKRKKIIFTILLTDSTYIKKLNKKFRKRNKATDVLSFPCFNAKDLRLMRRNKIYIGDIAVCFEVIKLRSKKNNFLIEFDKAWTHGLLHLIGYKHIKNKDYFKMNKVEKRIINSIESFT